ncbi:UNVERIFIED_CONTAM: hypothetical protein Slati_4408900 [Sesamum latifolium]|uniref:Uncharacterized protein n=1 Tax=Sesamum latifolium TaxID=2727402 RepID=A0AAW2SPR1_9LAMI
MFGVRGGMFLGFIVSQRGIETNLEKIEAITKIQPPKSIKEVQKLAWRIATLNCFISRSSDRGLRFFKVLKKIEGYSTTEQCQAASEDLKKIPRFTTALNEAKTGINSALVLSSIISDSE